MSLISGIVGAVIVVLLNLRFRKRFDYLYAEFTSLGEVIAGLTEEYTHDSDNNAFPQEDEVLRKGDIDSLVSKLHYLQNKLRAYIDFVKMQAKTDAMTGVNNKTVYLEKVREINQKIKENKAVFSVAVFDINSLKKINDNLGHEMGDRSIIASANVMKSVFGRENLYRIGGDEFIAVMEDVNEEEVRDKFKQLDDLIKAYAENNAKGDAIVSFSKGCASYRPEEDSIYRAVFKRADEELYRDKATFYENNGELF